MKKIKKGDGRKKTSYPCMKMKISKRGTEKEYKKTKNIMSLCENEKIKTGDGRKKTSYPCMKMKI